MMAIQTINASRIRCLAEASMLPGSGEKKFVREMKAKLDANAFERRGMTPGQHLFLARVAWKFRRQLPAGLAPRREPRTMNDDDMKTEFYGKDAE